MIVLGEFKHQHFRHGVILEISPLLVWGNKIPQSFVFERVPSSYYLVGNLRTVDLLTCVDCNYSIDTPRVPQKKAGAQQGPPSTSAAT